MNISQEILVLDFGDEKNRDFLRSEASTEYGRGKCIRLSVFFDSMKMTTNN